MLQGKILITGGAGTLGREIIKRATQENWDCEISIFSTDPTKHTRVRAQYPKVRSIIGDIRDQATVYNAMVGKDIVIHAAAVKEIPYSEFNSIDTYQINVEGSLNVCNAAIQLLTPVVIGISTDKACHPANAYGATKYLMEKTFQEYSRLGVPTRFCLVRYGNVLESSASVLEVWKMAKINGQKIKITNPKMTRFWLSPSMAVDLVVQSAKLPSGQILVPKLKSLNILTMAEYYLSTPSDNLDYEIVGMRPGEKVHEELITIDEINSALEYDEFFILSPTDHQVFNEIKFPFTSENTMKLSKQELMELLENE